MPTPAAYRAVADIVDALPALIRRARQDRGLSLRQVADQIGGGVDKTTVARWETGQQTLRVSNAADVLRWLAEVQADQETTRRAA